MTVLLVKAQSRYEATRVFIDEAAMACGRLGIPAEVADVAGEASPLDALADVYRDRPLRCVFSIGLFGESRDAEGRTLGQALKTPQIVQYVDYPLSHYFRLAKTPSETALLVVDTTHVQALRGVFGESRFPLAAFSPHGAIGDPDAPDPTVEAFTRKRDISLLFPGTFYKPATPLWTKLDRATQRIFDTALEMCLGAEFIPALDAFDAALDLYGGHLRGNERAEMRVNAFAVHDQVRAHRRFELLKATARARLPVHVVGGDYERDLYRFKNVTHLGEKTLPETIALMRRSKAVLSANANFGCGSHERPLTAMVAGAVAVTDQSEFYQQAFTAQEIVQYRWKSLDDDLQALSRLLENPDRLFAIAAAGQSRATAGHRWDARLPAILDLADAMRG